MPERGNSESARLHSAISDLEKRQRELGLDFSAQIAQLRQRLQGAATIVQSGSGAVATEGGVAAGEGGAAVGGGVGGHVVVAGDGATIVIGEQPIAMTAVQRVSALGRYLELRYQSQPLSAIAGHSLRWSAGQHRTGTHLRYAQGHAHSHC